MTSQVSFKFDGSHNKDLVVRILKNSLPKMRYFISSVNNNTYRIYVGADTKTEDEVLTVCMGIQTNAIFDRTYTF